MKEVMYEIGEKVHVKDEDDEFIYKGIIIAVNEDRKIAGVQYENDDRIKYRTATFDQLEYWRDVMQEASEWVV